MDKEIPYEELRNPRLPWGYWLETTGDAYRGRALRDENGNHWSSVREYFWEDRLGMVPLNSENEMHKQLEFLLAVLVTLDRRIVPIEEQVEDLFFSWEHQRFYRAWLSALGLDIPPHKTIMLTDPVPSEGQAIIVMLASSRPKGLVPLAAGLPTLEAHRGLHPESNTSEREKIIAKLEAFASRLDFRFERTVIGDEKAIKMVGEALGPHMPLRRTLWTMTFRDIYARDRFYLWLQHRLDRWNDWGELAHSKGGRALSDHLLHLKFADEPIDLAG